MTDGSYAVVAIVQSDIINMTGDAPTTTWLINHKPEIDREVDDDFRKYIDLIPFITGATNDLIAIANYRLGALWFASQKDYSSQKYWDARANNLRDRVIESARAQPEVNTRTASAFFGSDPRDSKIILPTQANIFAFDDYA
jgi:hypothetical protein